MTLSSTSVEVSDGQLWCVRDDAPSGPTVVFLHGFSVDHRMWNAQAGHLHGAATTLSYDLRGFGKSSPPHPGHSHVDDLIELLDHHDIERAIVVGLSLGANVALALAHSHANRVVAAVLASPGLPGWVWETPRAPDLAMAYAHEHGVDEARSFWLGLDLFAPSRANPTAKALLETMVADFPGHQWMKNVPASPQVPSLNSILESVSRPITVISGAEDDIGYRVIADEVVDRVPDSRGARLTGAGHFVNLDAPEAFNAELATSIQAVYARTSEFSS